MLLKRRETVFKIQLEKTSFALKREKSDILKRNNMLRKCKY